MSNDVPTYAIGITVGSNHIAGGLVDLSGGGVLARQHAQLGPERDGAARVAESEMLASTLLSTARGFGVQVRGIGIGVPDSAAPLAINTSERLSRLAPTVIDANSRCHALAEARYGAGHPYQTFMLVILDTDLNSCLVQDGVPFKGARGNAVSFANTPVSIICPECGTLYEPLLEQFASGAAMVARWNAITGMHATCGKDILAAAARDQAAAEIVQRAGMGVGMAVAWIVNLLDPEAVVVGGALGSIGSLYSEVLVETARNHIRADASRGLPITHATLGSDASLIGAAARVADHR